MAKVFIEVNSTSDAVDAMAVVDFMRDFVNDIEPQETLSNGLISALHGLVVMSTTCVKEMKPYKSGRIAELSELAAACSGLAEQIEKWIDECDKARGSVVP